MSKGTRITTLRIQPATLVEVDGAIESAAESPWPREYKRASWIRQAIREKLGHLRRSREYRQRRRHQVEDRDGSPATAAGFTGGGRAMGLVVSRAGRLDALARLVASYTGTLRVGLWQGELEISDATTLAWLVPATFAGYSGLQVVTGWSAPALEGELAVSRATPVIWEASGPSPANWIGGYYVVNAGGGLMWCEAFTGKPTAMLAAGNLIRVVPVFAQGSRLNQ